MSLGTTIRRVSLAISGQGNLVASADSQGAAAEEENGHVGSKRGGYLQQGRHRKRASRQLQISEQRSRGITGTAAQAATGRNRFV